MSATVTRPKERPILFGDPMVRAILEGRKTVARRVVVPKTEPKVTPTEMEPWFLDGERQLDDDGRPCWNGYHHDYPSSHGKWFSCNQGKVGDLLWVREAWRPCGVQKFGMGKQDISPEQADWYDYRADYVTKDGQAAFKWRPSIFMPKAACRLKLRITDVRVERLHKIKATDCIREGIQTERDINTPCGEVEAFNKMIALWDGINQKRGYGWDTNPFVWVVEFEKIEG